MSNTSNEPFSRYRKIAIRIRELVEERRLSSDSQMSVRKIAELMGEDADVVAEAITLYIGSSFDCYIDELRLMNAGIYFFDKKSNLYSMEAIAGKAGFADLQSFVAACHRMTGMTPEAMRDFVHNRHSLNGLFLNKPIYMTDVPEVPFKQSRKYQVEIAALRC